jgi:hypothetical protein
MAGRVPPGARDPARSGRPVGGRRSRGFPDAGQADRCPVRLVRSAVGTSVQPVERTSGVQASGVQASGAAGCPGVRCSRVSGRTRSGVRGAAALSAPRWTPEWLGVVGRPGRAQRVDVPVVRGRRGRLPASGRTGRNGSALAVLARMRSTVARAAAWPASGCSAALAPAGRHGALVQGQGAGRWREPGMEQVLTGPGRASWQVAGVVADHGLDQDVMTTLRGRWARMVPCRPAPEDPPGSVGEQPAAAARPQCVRSAVG